MLGRIIEIVNSSNLQRRPSIFKEFFASKKNKDFFLFKSAKLFGPFLTVYYMKSQKSTKAAALVALMVMTPLNLNKSLEQIS